MTISSSTIYKSTKYQLILDAFNELNTFGPDIELDADNYEFAGRLLNRMIKSWMNYGCNLWLRKTAILFTKKYQNTYSLSLTSNDHATLSYNSSTLSSDALIGSVYVILTDASTISSGDYIGIILDSQDIYWATVLSVVGNQVNFNAGYSLPSQATAGNVNYSYTTKLDNPLIVYEGVRRRDNIDVQLSMWSYDEYLRIPNKDSSTSTSIPVAFFPDKQLDEMIIRVWPAPMDSSTVVKLLIGQRAHNIDSNADEAEFPQEWHEAIVFGLAVRLAPAYGKHKDAGFQSLAALAQGSLENAKAFDAELGSIYFKPESKYA